MKKKITFFTRHLIFVVLLGIFTIPNLKAADLCYAPFTSGYTTIVWNETDRRFEFKFYVHDTESTNRWVTSFSVSIAGRDQLFLVTSSNPQDNESLCMITPNTSVLGGVLAASIRKTRGTSTSEYVVIDYNNVATRMTFARGDRAYIIIHWYPPQGFLEEDVSFSISSTIKRSTGASSTCSSYLRAVTATNPISPIEITNIECRSDGKYSISINRPQYRPAFDAGNRYYIERKNGASWSRVSEGTLSNLQAQTIVLDATASQMASGSTFRITQERATSGNYQRLKYVKTSNEYTVLPIRLPVLKNPEKLGCREYRLTWDVANVSSENTLAGSVRLMVHDGNSWSTVTSNIPFEDGEYIYTIPESYIDTGDRTFKFKINRLPFNSGVYYPIEQTVVENMNYQKIVPNSQNISGRGANSFYVAWSFDNGYSCVNEHEYKIKVTQGNISYTQNIGNSVTIQETPVDITGVTFNTCENIKIELNLHEKESGRLIVSNILSENFVLVNDATESNIEELTVSKGFYSNRVVLDWTVSEENTFARYLIYRNEISNTNSPNILLAAQDHLAGITRYRYEDLSANPGEYYNYIVEGQKNCGGGTILSTIATKSSIGLKQPYGVVSGRVSYNGTAAVEGATIIAEGTNTVKNKALDFSPNTGEPTRIEAPYKTGMLSPEAFTFQAWMLVRKGPNGTDPHSISFFTAFGKFQTMIHSNGGIALEFYKTSPTQPTKTDKEKVFFDTNIKLSDTEFKHVTITFLLDANNTATCILYINGEEMDRLTFDNITAANYSNEIDVYTGNIHAKNKIYVGRGYNDDWHFNGYMDELRIWKRCLSAEEIYNNYNCYISGKEEGLSLYYRFDELTNMDEVFDISGRNNNFNQNHGKIIGNVNRTSQAGQTPTSSQLSIKTLTDNNGHYLINTIPYTSDGDIFSIVPVFGVHQFNPTNRPLFFSYESNTHNNIDFSDISSFTVSGKVYYEGGSYPVEGCTFSVDGRTITQTNGMPIYTNEKGEYTISVPIGVHELKVEKNGHSFVNGGLALENGENINFQDNITNLNFKDITRVKLIGRITGGKIEHGKVLGFGESYNNIGATELKLKAKKIEYMLSCNEELAAVTIDSIVHHNNGEWTRSDSRLQQDSTIVELNGNEFTITVSPETGEFVAYVHPEIYEIQPIKVLLTEGASTDEIYNRCEILDLSQVAVDRDEMLLTSIRTWVDSVPAELRPGELPHNVAVQNADTIKYNAQWKYYYQAVPTFSFLQKDGEATLGYLGDTTAIITNPITALSDTVDLISFDNNNHTYLFDLPVFTQGRTYNFAMQAYEKYINFNRDADDDRRENIVPVTTGEVKIINNLKLNSSSEETIALDSLGLGTYEFCVGTPDLTTGIKNFEAVLQIDGVRYNWDWEETTIEAYVLGSKSTGTDFMTAGPDNIEIILHDPPGSLSTSYIERGTSVTNNVMLSVNSGIMTAAGIEADLGAKVITWAGFGGGTILENEVIAETSVGARQETTFKVGTEFETVTTYTEKFETSSDPLYVGHNGDVYIGNSTNLLYGLTNSIAVTRKTASIDPDDILFGDDREDGEYVIVKSYGLAFGQHFATRFAYTQVELEEIMIPKWKDNLKLLFYTGDTTQLTGITSPVYVSKLAYNDPNFGKRNTDVVAFGANASKADTYYDGPSYKIFFPENYNGVLGDTTMYGQVLKISMVDSVNWYNTNIELWEAQLAENERQKVQMESIGNYSFGSGAAIEAAYGKTTSRTVSQEISMLVNAEIAARAGFDALGITMIVTAESVISVGADESSSITGEESNTVGFRLQEEGDDDEITVDYGWTSGGTIAFKTRGGRTSCPYEGEVKTKYFEPGEHTLSEATMQIEVPVIDIKDGSYAISVPSNRPASFTLQLKNESETSEDVWFQLIVDEATNPYGAELKIDGGVIGNGRNFLVRAGEILEKTLTVAKGPNVDSYENIGLILRSQCQHDPTDFLQNIGDTTWISVEFIPSCSDINIKTPADQWLVNTVSGDTLNIILENYDVNYANFGYVNLQYRPTSSSTWKTLMKFYSNVDRYNNATGLKTLLNPNDIEIAYKWIMGTEADGTYELRAQTICETSGGTFVSEYTTPSVSGIKDMRRPTVFGKAQPADGVLSGANDIMIQFNENINEGLITENNFTVRGIKNGSQTSHTTAIHFDGLSSYMETEQEINLEDKSFTIEFWMKRNSLGASTILTHGTSEEALTIEFTNDNKLQVRMANTVVTSNYTFENTQEWTYWAVVYDGEASTITAYSAVGSTQRTEIDNAFVNRYYKTANIILARSIDQSNFGNFDMHGLKIWDKTMQYGELSMGMYDILTGNEISLAAYWPMNEGKGKLVQEKSRSRHGVINALWVNNPATKAATFSGTNSFMDINTGSTVVIGNNADFSIEFWFKGVNENAALFSAGRGDGLTSEPVEGKLSIFVENNVLKFAANGTVHTVSTENYLDGNWHHFALAVNRTGTANVYVDGNLAYYTAASQISSLSGAKMTIGARKWRETTERTDMYLEGNIDELRIWNMALTENFISNYNNTRLVGNEFGLIAYYPFDKYVTNDNDGLDLIFSIEDQVLENTTPSPIVSNVIASDETAPIKDAGPIVNYAFNYVSNGDKIILTLNEDVNRVENTHITIAARGIQDLNGNPMESAHTWNAYIDRSFLKWQEPTIVKSKKNNEALAFDVVIVNTGGKIETFTIDNIPSWLEITPSSGQVQPLSSQTLKFTIHDGLNQGVYDEMLYLKSEYVNMMTLKLNVGTAKPDWSVDPSQYEASMSIIGQIKIEGRFSKDSEDLVAAFVKNKCVGVASPKYNKEYDMWHVMLSVYENTDDVALEFRVWDASTGKIYANVLPIDMLFKSNTIHGSMLNPVVFETTNSILQTIDLVPGWNWVSFNTKSTFLNDMNILFNDVDCAQEIKSQEANIFSRFNPSNNSWINANLGGAGIDNKKMYMVKTSNTDKIYVSGTAINPAETSISIKQGWNWIAYIPQINMTVNEAFSGFTPENGDIVKSISNFAVYSSDLGWVGSLEYMRTNIGYMYKSAKDVDFKYPSYTQLGNNTKSAFEKNSFRNAADYENNLSLIATVDIGREIPQTAKLVAKVNGEPRGAANITYINEKPVFFVSVHGNNNQELLTFSLITDESDIQLSEYLTFNKNQIIGTLDQPKIFTIQSKTANVFPNPTRNQLFVEFDSEDNTSVVINLSDITGKQIFSSTYNANAGMNQISLGNVIADLKQGMYIIRLYMDDEVRTFKILKQ
ncbi:T9SS type A sorting domain-containing protein [Bacteroidales bacterium OttesenSCG-928-I21]|nr:T9SS type A sorting domain-containing protein [Bacteroidales bacterium OttesenSCG-928-I21]